MKIGETRFGTLLKVRTIQEKKTQDELTQIRTKKEEERQTLTRLEETRDSEIEGNDTKSKMSAKDLQTSRAFLRRIATEIASQQDKVGEIEAREDAKRDELVERSQSRKMVENLDEKSRAQAVREADRKEQRLIDVLAQRVKLET